MVHASKTVPSMSSSKVSRARFDECWRPSLPDENCMKSELCHHELAQVMKDRFMLVRVVFLAFRHAANDYSFLMRMVHGSKTVHAVVCAMWPAPGAFDCVQTVPSWPKLKRYTSSADHS